MGIILKLLASENNHGEDRYFTTPDANINGQDTGKTGGGFKYIERSRKKGKRKEVSDFDIEKKCMKMINVPKSLRLGL